MLLIAMMVFLPRQWSGTTALNVLPRPELHGPSLTDVRMNIQTVYA